ncbi:hypothetical protein AB0M92_36535 [Streptomyces sp. NPDC051582]|uniref:hypothetical protein n=1 Tax=Streptomyces sp. NPDC051582 TaxID=3155167 RepID=UPI003413F0D9
MSHPILRRAAFPGAVLAAAAALVLGASTASAAVPQPAASGPVVSAAAAWTPPPGYVRETAYVGSLASCETKGAEGVANGAWTAYVCHQEYRQLTDIWMLFTSLYVKK